MVASVLSIYQIRCVREMSEPSERAGRSLVVSPTDWFACAAKTYSLLSSSEPLLSRKKMPPPEFAVFVCFWVPSDDPIPTKS